MSQIIRHHKSRKPDDKGDRRLIGGKRWRIPKGSVRSEAEYHDRYDRIERLFRDNERHANTWLEVSLHAAEHIRKGATEIPLPHLDDLFNAFEDHPTMRRISGLMIEEVISGSGNADDLDFDLVMDVFEMLRKAFPSVHWSLPRRQQLEIAAFHEKQARYSMTKYAEAKDMLPPPASTPLIAGRLHEMLNAYKTERQKQFEVPGGEITQAGHAAVSLEADKQLN